MNASYTAKDKCSCAGACAGHSHERGHSMTEKVSPDAAKNSLLHRLMGHIAKSATPAELADMLGETVAKGEAVSPQLSHAIPDLWTGSKETAVGTDLEIGGGMAAKGNEPSKIISAYSQNQTTQMGATADASRLGEMVNCLDAVRKAVNEISNDHTLMKSILIKLAKAEPEKEVEEEKKEADEDGEFGKAVKAIVAKAEPLVASAKERIETAKSMTAEGFPAQAETARFGAAEFIVKARKLVEAAKSMDPANAAVVAIAKAMDDMKEEFTKKDDKEETAKSEVVVAETVKAVPAIQSTHNDEIMILKSTVNELMDKLAGRPMEVAKGKPELPVGSQTAGIDGIQSIIRAKEDEGSLTSAEASAAMDLSAMRQADLTGILPKGIYDQKLAIMPASIKAIFSAAA